MPDPTLITPEEIEQIKAVTDADGFPRKIGYEILWCKDTPVFNNYWAIPGQDIGDLPELYRVELTEAQKGQLAHEVAHLLTRKTPQEREWIRALIEAEVSKTVGAEGN